MSLSRCDTWSLLFGCAIEGDFPGVCCCTSSGKTIQDNRQIPKLEQHIHQLPSHECDAVLAHWAPHSYGMCTNEHTINLMQKLLTRCSPQAVAAFICLCRDLKKLMIHEHGSRVIETVAQIHGGSFAPLLIGKIGGAFASLATDPRANMIMTQLAANVHVSKMAPLLANVVPFSRELSVDPHGAYVLQVILRRLPEVFGNLESVEEPGRLKHMCDTMLLSLVELGPTLIQHRHGNFTVQAMVGVLRFCDCAWSKLVSGICEKIVEYVRCPFGMRVVECALDENGGDRVMTHTVVERIVKLKKRDFHLCFSKDGARQHLLPKVMRRASEYQKKCLVSRFATNWEWIYSERKNHSGPTNRQH